MSANGSDSPDSSSTGAGDPRPVRRYAPSQRVVAPRSVERIAKQHQRRRARVRRDQRGHPPAERLAADDDVRRDRRRSPRDRRAWRARRCRAAGPRARPRSRVPRGRPRWRASCFGSPDAPGARRMRRAVMSQHGARGLPSLAGVAERGGVGFAHDDREDHENRRRVARRADTGAVPRPPREGDRARVHGRLLGRASARRLSLRRLRRRAVRRRHEVRVRDRLAVVLPAGRSRMRSRPRPTGRSS